MGRFDDIFWCCNSCFAGDLCSRIVKFSTSTCTWICTLSTVIAAGYSSGHMTTVRLQCWINRLLVGCYPKRCPVWKPLWLGSNVCTYTCIILHLSQRSRSQRRAIITLTHDIIKSCVLYQCQVIIAHQTFEDFPGHRYLWENYRFHVRGEMKSLTILCITFCFLERGINYLVRNLHRWTHRIRVWNFIHEEFV